MALNNFEDYNNYVTTLIIGNAEKAAIDIELFISQLTAAGVAENTIENLLLEDLKQGGRIFGAIQNQIATTVKSNINIVGNVASMSQYERAGVQEFKWITATGSNICPDCEEREGRVEPMEIWESIGTPASGWSVCREHCNCELAPVQYDGKTNFGKP